MKNPLYISTSYISGRNLGEEDSPVKEPLQVQTK
jgi:hypothetical protein